MSDHYNLVIHQLIDGLDPEFSISGPASDFGPVIATALRRPGAASTLLHPILDPNEPMWIEKDGTSLTPHQCRLLFADLGIDPADYTFVSPTEDTGTQHD